MKRKPRKAAKSKLRKRPIKRLPRGPYKTEAQKAATRAAENAKRLSSKAQRTMLGQDIGKIPACADPERRAKCLADYGLFCKTYFGRIFYHPWSKDHLKVIAKIERVVIDHDKLAVAMPRGSGKSSLCRAAILWSILSGRHRFAVLIGAVASDGGDSIVWFKKALTENDLIAADFPEVCVPLQKLDNEPRRCLGQRYRGIKTNIRWGKDRIVLPTIPGSAASSSVIHATSLEGHVRGLWFAMPDGTVIRPTLAMGDDPQTPEALDVDTPILTPSGFVKMLDLKAGDLVYGDDGSPCCILETSEVMIGRPCYRVKFDDGTSIVADAGHKWVTSTALQRTNARRRVNEKPAAYQRSKPLSSIVTTEEILNTLRAEGGRNNHSIPLCGQIRHSKMKLPIPPYTFGAWLGDGCKVSGRITTTDEGIIERIRRDGFVSGKYGFAPNSKAWCCTIIGLGKLLRLSGLLGVKRIPPAYLFASRGQRVDLLRGLMDTDGTIKNGETGIKGIRCSFSNTNKSLISSVVFLCRSLGIKPTITNNNEKYPGCLPSRNVNFITTEHVFYLKRKLDRLPQKIKPSVQRRYVVSVERIPAVPVKCICVDSASHLYLCGDGLIPTHNSSRSQGPTGQTTYRLQVINQDVQGLAGPDEQTAILVPGTVIERGDLMDQLLNRQLYPDYRGERTKRLYAWPTNKALWEEYRELREAAIRLDAPLDESIAFYRARMCDQGRTLDDDASKCTDCPRKATCMDCGAIVDNPHRLDDKRNLSAVQAAMHSFYKYGPAGFAAEFQNEPLKSEALSRLPSAEEIMAKANGYARGLVPGRALHLTSFIDVGDDYFFWLVAGWAPDFTGWVIDYGTFPDQGLNFSKASVRRSLGDRYPGTAKDGAILAGINEFAGSLMARQFPQEGGPPQQIGLCLVDTGYKPDAVYAAMRMVGRGTSFRPSRGRGITAGKTQFEDYKRERCREMGYHWWVPKESPQSVIQIDTNFYKTFVHSRLATAAGDPGALTLFGKPADHRLLAAHVLAEYYTLPSTERGVAVQEWHQHVGQDNEGFDALVGAAVAASKLGCSVLPAMARVSRPVVSYAQRKAARSA